MTTRPVDVVRLFLAAEGLSIADANGNHINIPEKFQAKDLLSEDFELVCMPGMPLGGTKRGKAAWSDTAKPLMEWFDIGTSDLAIYDAADLVFLTLTNKYTYRNTGEAVDMPCVEIYKVRAGTIVSMVVYFTETHTVERMYRDGLKLNKPASGISPSPS